MLSLHIIGGTGFFGKSFLEKKNLDYLYRKKFKKIIISSRSTKNFYINKRGIEIFFKRINALNVKSIPVTDIIIYAATSSLKKNYKKNLNNEIDNSLWGLKNILKILKKKDFKRTKFLFTSSGAVYGETQTKVKISERKSININKINKNNPEKYAYAIAKIKSEELVKKFSLKYKRKVMIARCFAFIGENIYLNEHFFIGNLINAILYKKKLVINLKNPKLIFRSYMNSYDLVQSLILPIIKQKKKCVVLNIGSDKAYSILSIIKRASKKYPFSFANRENNENNIDYYIPNIDKLKKIIRVKLNSNLMKDLNEIIKFYKKNKNKI